jgi:hypothetical protein
VLFLGPACPVKVRCSEAEVAMIRYVLMLGGAAGLVIGVTLAMRPQAEELDPLQKIERECIQEYSPDSAKVEFCTDTLSRRYMAKAGR